MAWESKRTSLGCANFKYLISLKISLGCSVGFSWGFINFLGLNLNFLPKI